MLGEFFKLAARLIGPDTNQTQLRELRQVYIKASAQTCSSIERWISHVCVGMNSSEEPAEFDFSCQHEFVALLMVTFNFTNSYLSWSIGVKLVLLVQILLPPLRQAIENMLSSVCCVSRNELTTMTVKTIIQESSPPLDYEEVLEVYLRSLRVRDPDRMAAEREAFEKEWSSRTGRVLSDVRTPRVVVSSSDFSAIVRTLMLRRLTAICKLDVSLSVSEDGQLLLVRISASDNLLLATSCETESYRLQFADAIDPGRSFWRDKKEVNTDQKVLDANTVKHKLKILLAENAMSPKEAVWFPADIEPGVFAPTEAEIINRESVNDDDLLEEKEDVSLSTTDAAVESPRRSFLSRIRSRQVKSSISDSNKDSQVEAGERALLRQLSPRLSSLPRKSKRLSSKVSGSEESKSESSSVREPPAPKRLSNLFKRAQSPSTRTTPPSEPPPIVTNREAEDTTVDPVAPRHDQFAFLSDTRAYLSLRFPHYFPINLLVGTFTQMKSRVHYPYNGERQAATGHDPHHRLRCTLELTCRGLKRYARQQIATNSTFLQTNKVSESKTPF
ncbi:CMP-sialic acid transporter 4 [Phytophthora nicotianae]|uniref:CMP-sialic acid transporter 4 n=1 Tax=Phytophthora nicotianae TaxID=4792 RepID=A0A0W8DU24_PHYNI|nr:CMP-sialic acid transporter 4 [Phytophthora nicotianae]